MLICNNWLWPILLRGRAANASAFFPLRSSVGMETGIRRFASRAQPPIAANRATLSGATCAVRRNRARSSGHGRAFSGLPAVPVACLASGSKPRLGTIGTTTRSATPTCFAITASRLVTIRSLWIDRTASVPSVRSRLEKPGPTRDAYRGARSDHYLPLIMITPLGECEGSCVFRATAGLDSLRTTLK